MEVGQGPNWGCSAKEKNDIPEDNFFPAETLLMSLMNNNGISEQDQKIPLFKIINTEFCGGRMLSCKYFSTRSVH
jgi:hypothetical protein